MPPRRLGGSIYCAGGPNYAPHYPEGAVVGHADGSGNSGLVRRIAQILDGPKTLQKSRTLRDMCVAVRTSLVYKYGRSPHAELDLTAWRRLIIEELGGRPLDWDVLFWAFYRYI